MSQATRTRRINIYINGKQVSNDIKSISAEMRKLERETRTLNRESKEYHDNIARIRQLKAIISQHNQSLAATKNNLSSMKGLANAFTKYWFAILGTISTFAGAIFSVKNLTDSYARLDDKLTDVQKTTGLSREQVMRLNEAFKQIDTRLTQEQLLDLAYTAGKLGITAEQDILGFVNASNKLAVALAKDLGGSAEETMTILGKIVQLFNLQDVYGIEEALLKVGSSINSLGMSSSANEKNMVNFTNRVAAVGNMAGISLPNILGLGATIDALAISSEVAGTAYAMFMGQMAKQPATFANLAGMDLDSFINLINSDANEAFLKVLESISSTEGGFVALRAAVGEAGLEGQRAVQVISGLAQQTDFLRSQQQLATKEFLLGTSIMEEYELKNNTAKAATEKNTKAIENMRVELGEKLQPVMISGQNIWVRFLKTLQTVASFLIDNSKAITSLTASFVAYRVALIAVTIWNERLIAGTIGYRIAKAAQIVVDRIWIGLVGTQIVLTDLFTRKITLATAATRIFSVALGMTGIPALISILAGAGTAIGLYVAGMKKANQETIDLAAETNRLTKEKQEEIVKEQVEVETLTGVITKLNDSSSLRISLIKKLKEGYPELLGFVDAETVSNEDLLTAMESVNANIKERIRLAALEAKAEILKKKMVENAVRMLDIEDQRNKAQKEFDELKAKGIRTDQKRFNNLMEDFSDEYDFFANANQKLEDEFFFLTSQITAQKTEISALQIQAYTKQKELIESTLAAEKQYATLDKNKISALNVQLAQIERKLSLSKKQQQVDEFSEISEQKEVLEAKKRFASGETSKENHEIKLKEIELKYIQGRLQTRQYEDAERIALEIKAQETIVAIKENFTKIDDKNTGNRLKNDFVFQQESNRIMQEFLSGKIQTEEAYNNELLNLEIRFLQSKLDGLKAGTNEYIETENELFTKQIAQTKNRLQREQALIDAATTDEISLAAKKYKTKLFNLGLHGVEMASMTEIQLKAYNSITSEYYKELDRIDADRIKDYLDGITYGHETELELMRERHRDELAGMQGSAAAKKAIQEKQAKEEMQFVVDHIQKMKAILDKLRDQGVIDGLLLSDNISSPEELKVLANAYKELMTAFNGFSPNESDPSAKMQKQMQGMFGAGKNDFFGFSAGDWLNVVENFGDKWGKLELHQKIETASVALLALSNATEQYFDVLAKHEARAFQQTEKKYEAEKEKLREKLDFGLISQESYNAKVAEMDAELDRKRAIMERKQAVREKALALFNATIQGAVSIVSSLKNPVLAAIVATAVAAQLALIAATPLPEVPGAEAGGHMVERAQDGRKFKAKFAPNKRGYVHRPTVLVGEGGSEYVVPNTAMKNPTIRPVLQALELARLNGNLASVNFDDFLIKKIYNGKQLGGYMQQPTTTKIIEKQLVKDPETNEILRRLQETTNQLNHILKNGIKSSVSLYGSNGLKKAQEMDEIIRRNANL